MNYSPKEPTRTLKRNQIRSVRLVWSFREILFQKVRKGIFSEKRRKYDQTTRFALHRIIRIELNGEVFYRLELFACLCRRRCVEYSFNQRYALGILDILQALFSIPDCSKEGRVVVFFKRAFSKTLFVSLSLFLSRSLSLSTTTLSLQSIVPRGRLFFEKLFGIFVFGETAFDFFFRKLDMFRLAVGFEFASVRERFAVG